MSITYTGTKTIYITERIHEYSAENCPKCSQILCQRQTESDYSSSKSLLEQKSATVPVSNCGRSQQKEQTSSWTRNIFSVLPQSIIFSGYFARLLARHNGIESSEIGSNLQKEVKTVYITEKVHDSKMAPNGSYWRKSFLPSQNATAIDGDVRRSRRRKFCLWPILFLLALLPLCAILHYTLTRAASRRAVNVFRHETPANQKFALSDYPSFMLHLLNRKMRENFLLFESKLNNLFDRFAFLSDKTDLIANNYIDFREKLSIMERNLTSKAENFELLMNELQKSTKESLNSEINERMSRFERDRIKFEQQIREQYQQAFEEFKKKIVVLEAKPCNCPPPFVGTDSAESDVSSSNVKAIVQKAIETYDADKTGLPDYASEPAGGSILNIRCTETYTAETRRLSWWLFSLMYFDYPPRTIIQPGIAPGLCWAFKGAHGRVVIKLSTTIKVTGVTYEHIPQSIAPQGKIDSAPKKMQLLGLQMESDPRPVVLANFTYEIKGKPLQYFPISEINRGIPIVELIVWSNHGHPSYTCLYRFRVHGVPVLKV